MRFRVSLPCSLVLSTLLIAGCAGADDQDSGSVDEEELSSAAASYKCVDDSNGIGVGFNLSAKEMELWWLEGGADIGVGKRDRKYRPTNPDNFNFAAYKGFDELIDSHDSGSITMLVDKPLLRRAKTGVAKLRSVSEHSGFSEYVLTCHRQ